jgi:hypothetical protein
MASAWSASLYGGLGAEPPVGSRGKAPGGGSGGLRPPEAEDILLLYDEIFTQKSFKFVKIAEILCILSHCTSTCVCSFTRA